MNEHVKHDSEENSSEEVVKETQNIQGEAEKDIVISAAEYQKLVEDSAGYKDKYVRILAEFDNARKRNERDRAELIKYAHEEVIIEILGLHEDLERSLDSSKKFGTDANLIKGLELVVGKMRELLKKYDVKPVESVGKKFDPVCHEAMMQAESQEHEDGTVVEEFQRGYWLGDRVVRTAKVKVAKKSN
ncbi:MAG: nucleotide exchange factor GrpE [Candidatus Omnitrophica bacterium]|nr:nucleotide exchange factor GrpE [Candidatus Omnitrophota bacterium]